MKHLIKHLHINKDKESKSSIQFDALRYRHNLVVFKKAETFNTQL